MLLIPLEGKVSTFAPYGMGHCGPVGAPNLQLCYFFEAVHPVRCDGKGAREEGMLPLPRLSAEFQSHPQPARSVAAQVDRHQLFASWMMPVSHRLSPVLKS